MSVLEEMPGEEVAKLKLSLNELSSLSWKAFDAMPLMLSPLETVRFMLSLLVVCATNLSWETQALLPNYSQYQSLSAHPLTIIFSPAELLHDCSKLCRFDSVDTGSFTSIQYSSPL